MSKGDKCQVCEKDLDTAIGSYLYVASGSKNKCGDSWFVCSPSCLVELAWGLKERQEKISKSKVEAKE